MKIGERIKDLRMSMGMKPVDLATSIGKSVSYINTLEADRNDPYVQTLCLIAQKLGTTLRFLVLGDKNTLQRIISRYLGTSFHVSVKKTK